MIPQPSKYSKFSRSRRAVGKQRFTLVSSEKAPSSVDPEFKMERDRFGHPLHNHPLKGKRDGACNRSACQRVPATWYNRGSLAYYCPDCADDLNRANAGFTDFVQPLCVRADGQPHTMGRHEFSEDGLHKWNMSDGTIQAMTTTDAIRTRRT